MSQKGHPVHPATVHFPIVFTAVTGALDAVYWASKIPATAGLVNSMCKWSPNTGLRQHFNSTIATILFTLPAIMTGVAQLAPVIQRNGFSSKKAKVGAVHALLNDIALAGTIYNWWTRSQQTSFVPSTTNVFVSAALALPITMYSAYLGGSLVYEYGMGFSKSSPLKKSQ